ncbi:zinc finger and BTB domain-containing protein 11 [Corythoichthys intestinalis]|uniref:zinc finger and BTB domain-containing protein 11 n=1 Tax=Corythoichthys intestinalis TaxID=161448 RepID=UPI0025A5F8C3|nr:zinc finger and BTB domain-containing protein 11 [Corythoichthys intestinalis]XP_061790159.1 zinc finger and BTB domain-containing protein 11-like [Nerophis lumbriciformis]
MSCEESYLAIIRYLTDEREPYAPGTPGNTKRKIRKAAACYVVREGTLFYQRRLKGQDAFTELEVVLRDERRKELIERTHVTEAGEHLTQQLTWESISQKYWWRGILNNVKDYIRECAICASRRGADDGSGVGGRAFNRVRKRKRDDDDDDYDEEDDELEEGEEADDILFFGDTSRRNRSKSTKAGDKHGIVYVNSNGEVQQFLSKHGQTMLDRLNQQRLNNQFCDITLLIEGEDYRAHKAVLAACSEYFNELFFEKGAATTHEAVVDLAGFTKDSFMPLLDFAYTSTLTFNFSVMAEIANLARHLLMPEVLQICETVHKQVEDQKLVVYQRGDSHTVEADQTAVSAANEAGAYTVTIQSDGSAVVTHTGLAVAGESFAIMAPAGSEQPVAVTAEAVEGGETLTLITHQAALMGEEGETMTLVTHSGQAGASESLAVVSACLAIEQPDGAENFLLNMEAEQKKPEETSVEPLTQVESVPETLAPQPLKRKRGRPAKVKKDVLTEAFVSPPPLEDEAQDVEPSAADSNQETVGDSSQRRLRQRSMIEGGYARLHMGLDEDDEGKVATTPTTPKVGPRPGKRGRPPKQPEENPAEAAPGSVTDQEPEGAEATQGENVCSTEPAELDTLLEADPDAGAEAPAEGDAEGEHTCHECGISFPRRYALIMHAMKHEKGRGYKCSLCSKEFQYAASLRAHLARHKQQSGQRGPVPKSASQSSSSTAGRDPPWLSAKREFVCDICGKTLPKLYSLRIHMLHHTGVRPHSCKVCGKTFAHKHGLKMHRALHDVTKQFQCQYCHKSFVSKRSMEEHTSLHTGESKYLCNTCGATFHRASALSKHLKKHRPKPDVRAFACSHCDKSFYEAKDLQQHMNKHMGLKPFQCQVCGKCYSWKKDWYSHVKSHSVAEPFKCNVCGKEFFEKALFRRHVKKATHGKKGRVKQNLERECEDCGRKFTQLREYRRHINNHQGVKPFECVTCGVAWADARSLKRHVRTHTGERPYVCPNCQEAHIDARTLRKHMTKYHADSLPGKIMLEKDTLQFHNQGTQVEHAVSILTADLPPELRPPETPCAAEEIETVLITEETVEAVQAVQAAEAAADGSMATLSDQGIMQVVNYVLAQQAITGVKLEEAPEAIQTMEVEVTEVE